MKLPTISLYDIHNGIEFFLYIPARCTTDGNSRADFYRDPTQITKGKTISTTNPNLAPLILTVPTYEGILNLGAEIIHIDDATKLLGEEMIFQAKLSGDTSEINKFMVQYRKDHPLQSDPCNTYKYNALK